MLTVALLPAPQAIYLLDFFAGSGSDVRLEVCRINFVEELLRVLELLEARPCQVTQAPRLQQQRKLAPVILNRCGGRIAHDLLLTQPRNVVKDLGMLDFAAAEEALEHPAGL